MSRDKVAETSKQHYQDMIESGQLGSQCRKVLETMLKLSGNPTLNELGHTMELNGLSNSTISGRLNDLKDLGLVQDLSGDAKREDKYSGITCKVWTLTSKAKRKNEIGREFACVDEVETIETGDLEDDGFFVDVDKKSGEQEQSQALEPGDIIYKA